MDEVACEVGINIPRQMTLAARLLVAAFVLRIADYLLGCFAPSAEVDWSNTPGWIAIGLGIRSLFVGVLLLEVCQGERSGSGGTS